MTEQQSVSLATMPAPVPVAPPGMAASLGAVVPPGVVASPGVVALPAAITRVLIPRRREGTVSRRRLTDFLHRHLERRLLLLAAPAGYGKTTLAVEFAHEVREQGVPVCWLTLDEADRDVRSFFEHLLLSFQQRYPAFGRRTAALLRSVENVSRERQAIATTFCNELAAEVNDFCLFVCDDFQVVADIDAVNDVFDLLLRRMPEGAHVLLSSRQLPTKLNLTRLAARFDVAGLSMADLRFQLAEAQELARLRAGAEVAPNRLRQAAYRTEGWVTGLLLALQGPDTFSFRPAGGGKPPPEPAYRFLATQVFDALPSRLQRFLMESAVLPALSAEECAGLLERAGAAADLDEVLRLGLFVEPLEGPQEARATLQDGTPVSLPGDEPHDLPGSSSGGPWLRYHQLWREFLLARFAAEDPARLAALRRRLSHLALAAGSPDVAVGYLLAGHEWEAAARLLVPLGEAEIIAGRAERLLSWIERLPGEVLDAHPVLGYHAARALRRLDRVEESVRTAERAERLALAHGERDVALQARMWRAEMLAFLGQADAAVNIVDDIFRPFGRHGLHGALAARLEREACITLGITRRYVAAVHHGMAALKRLRSIPDSAERAYIGATIHHTAGICLARLGEPAAAARHYRQAAALWQRLENTTQQARVLSMQAALHQTQGDEAAARAAYEAALDLATDVGHVSTQVIVLNNLARLHREQGRFDEAREALARALPLARTLEERSLLAEALQEAGALALQEPPEDRTSGTSGANEAGHLLEAAREAAGDAWPAGQPFTRALLALAYARAHQRAPATILLNELAAAGQRAQGALADARLRVEAARLAAQVALGQRAEAAAALRALRRWARDRERTPALHRESARYPETARLLLAQRGVPADTRAALAASLARSTITTPAPVTMATGAETRHRSATPALRLVPPLETDYFQLHLFGAPALTRNGTPVRAWRAQRARDVLFYLALHAGRTVRTEVLLDALVPEVEFERGLTALRYAIYQVRRLFAPLEPLRTEKSGYRFTLEPGMWCDAVEFQRLLEDASRAERTVRRTETGGDPAAAAAAREVAVALYTGPLLEGFDAAWVLPLRAQFERQFLSAASALLAAYAQQQRHLDAVQLAQRVLRLDPFREEFHLALLRHQVAAGHLAAAQLHFDYYRRLVHDELGQEPAEALQHLAEALQLRPRFAGA